MHAPYLVQVFRSRLPRLEGGTKGRKGPVDLRKVKRDVTYVRGRGGGMVTYARFC